MNWNGKTIEYWDLVMKYYSLLETISKNTMSKEFENSVFELKQSEDMNNLLIAIAMLTSLKDGRKE